jgi:hypothetical protein
MNGVHFNYMYHKRKVPGDNEVVSRDDTGHLQSFANPHLELGFFIGAAIHVRIERFRRN